MSPKSLYGSRRPGTHLAAFSSVDIRPGIPPSSALRCTHLNDATRNIMTLEDPVEYPTPMIRQTSVSETSRLDFASGIAVNLLGHSHPGLIGAIQRQAETLMHVSNLYGSPQGEALAQRLVDLTFADTVFFTNSGAEAVECAIKTARAYHQHAGNDEKYELIMGERRWRAIQQAGLATIPAIVRDTQDDAMLRDALLDTYRSNGDTVEMRRRAETIMRRMEDIFFSGTFGGAITEALSKRMMRLLTCG